MYERPSKRTGLWVVLTAAIPPLVAFEGEVYTLIPSLDSLQILAFMIYGGAWTSQAPLDMGGDLMGLLLVLHQGNSDIRIR